MRVKGEGVDAVARTVAKCDDIVIDIMFVNDFMHRMSPDSKVGKLHCTMATLTGARSQEAFDKINESCDLSSRLINNHNYSILLRSYQKSI